MSLDIGLTEISYGTPTSQIVGCDLTIGRGTRPGVCRLRVADLASITEDTSRTLTLVEDGRVLVLENCTAVASTMRLHNTRRDYPEWVVNVYDERYRLRQRTVCGEYNRRAADNSVLDDGSKKTPAELLADLMGQVGASYEVSSSALSGVYPYVNWSSKPWAEAVEELCDKLCLHLASLSNGTWKFWASGEGDELPSSSSEPNVNADSPIVVDSGPKTVVVECNKTKYGCRLELEAVGLELDGTYQLLDDLSYAPSHGWGHDWPMLFSYVQPYYRPLALRSVYRCYRIKAPQTLPWDGVAIAKLDDLELLDTAISEGSPDDWPPYVAGIFWGYSDHPYNVAKCPYTSMPFTLDKQNRLIVFEQPVFKIGASDCIEPADIGLYISFHLRDSTTGCWHRETYEKTRETGSGRRVYRHDDLWRTRIKNYTECPPAASESDNESALSDEAMAYVNNYAAHWDAMKIKRVLEYPGMRPLLPNGKIAQLTISVGKNLTGTTVASEHFEHNAYLR